MRDFARGLARAAVLDLHLGAPQCVRDGFLTLLTHPAQSDLFDHPCFFRHDGFLAVLLRLRTKVLWHSGLSSCVPSAIPASPVQVPGGASVLLPLPTVTVMTGPEGTRRPDGDLVHLDGIPEKGARDGTFDTGGRPAAFTGVFNLHRHKGRLYLARQSGAAYLQPAGNGSPARILPVEDSGIQCWWFETMRDAAGARPPALVTACTDGLFEIRDTKAVPIRAPRDNSWGRA